MKLEKKPGPEMVKPKSKLEKWFPARQILLRGPDGVRYLNLSPLFQKTVAGGLAVALLWGGYASYNTVFEDRIIAAKDDEISALEAENAQKQENIETLQTSILEKTEELERRQGYLKSIIETDPTGALPQETGEEDPEPQKESYTPGDGFLFKRAMAATDPAMDGETFLRHINDRLAQIEAEQDELARVLNDFALGRLGEINDMLAPFKLTASDLANATPSGPEEKGRGGPFMPEAASGFNLSDDTSFSALSDNWTTLLRAYNGFQNIPLTEPVEDFFLSSRFGRRIDPFTKKTGWHPGIDLAGWPGTKIFSTTEGVVTKAGIWGGYGQMVEIDHGNGFKTRYAHMRKIVVKRGQTVSPGDILGEMGCTGRCESTHLHYEVYFNGSLRNPQPFMEAPEDVQQTKKRANTHPANPQNGTGD